MVRVSGHCAQWHTLPHPISWFTPGLWSKCSYPRIKWELKEKHRSCFHSWNTASISSEHYFMLFSFHDLDRCHHFIHAAQGGNNICILDSLLITSETRLLSLSSPRAARKQRRTLASSPQRQEVSKCNRKCTPWQAIGLAATPTTSCVAHSQSSGTRSQEKLRPWQDWELQPHTGIHSVLWSSIESESRHRSLNAPCAGVWCLSLHCNDFFDLRAQDLWASPKRWCFQGYCLLNLFVDEALAGCV